MKSKVPLSSEEKNLKEKGILFVIGSLNTGGAENHLAQVASGLFNRGWHVEIFLLSPYKDMNPKYLNNKIKIYSLSKNLNNKNDSKSLINGTFTDFEDFRGFEKLMDRRSYNEILKTFKKKNIPIFKFSSLVRKDREGNLLKRMHKSKPKEYYNNTIFFKRAGGKPFVDIKAEEKRFKKPFANVLSYELDSKKILSDYLLIVLTSTFSDKIINQYTTGITIPNLRPEFLENIEIAVPSIKNQKLIIKNDKDIKALKEYLSNSFENIYEDMNVAANDPEKIQENIKKIKTTFLKPTKSDEIKSLILQGEGNKIEFKQTFAMDIKDKKKKDYLVHEVIKNLLGFMNHQGGTVLVGVRDDGVITGINEEIKCEFKNSKDEFLKYFQNKIRDRIGVGLNPLIDHNIIRVDKKLIFKITAKVSDKLCYEKTTGDLYVRLPAGTKRLSAKEANDYEKSRDKNLPLNT